MTPTIALLDAGALTRHLNDLAALLHACVHDGASIGFILPHTMDDAERFWRHKVLPGVEGGGVSLLVARQGERVVGTVQLDHDTPGNGRHRAEVRKLLVHPEARRQGVARALMAAIEDEAGRRARSLLVLDTRSDSEAEPLYLSLGYQVAGRIPHYCRDNFQDRLDPTTVMYKTLTGAMKGTGA